MVCGKLDLLDLLFNEAYISQFVYEELTVSDKPGIKEISNWVLGKIRSRPLLFAKSSIPNVPIAFTPFITAIVLPRFSSIRRYSAFFSQTAPMLPILLSQG
jgi:hypothetical protein